MMNCMCPPAFVRGPPEFQDGEVVNQFRRNQQDFMSLRQKEIPNKETTIRAIDKDRQLIAEDLTEDR